MSENSGQRKVENVIIVGGGPAGYTAALYTARANLEPLAFEGFQWGGQLQNTTDVENYPGYPEGIMGPEMMSQFRAQAERFGTRFVTDDVDRVELSDGGVQKVYLGDEEHLARTVILAMGAEPRRLGVPGELELSGCGVSTCGVCDGAFFKGKEVIVIGGGDSAMEDAIFVSNFASRLTIVNPQKNPDTCFQCHLEKRGEFSLPHAHGVMAGKMGCSECHDPHGGNAIKGMGASLHTQVETCTECHTAQKGPFIFKHNAIKEGCTACHSPHGSVNQKMLKAPDSNLCLQCHATGSSPGMLFASGRDHAGNPVNGTCWVAGCHESIHGSNASHALRF